MKIRVLILLLGFSVFFLSCAPQTKKAKPRPVATIKIAGSGTCRSLIEILTREYSKSHPEVKIKILPNTRSRGGIEGVAQGLLDVGLVSRKLKPEEKALGLTYLALSNDGLVVATHNSVKIKNLSTQQVKDIYSGKIKNWKELGGEDAPIVVLDHNEDEAAKIIFRQYVLGKTLSVTKTAIILYYETDMVEALKKTPNTIGYLSLGCALSNKIPINLVSLDGVTPSVANVLSGKYKVIRPLGIVYKKLTPQAENLIDFFRSDEAKKLMIKNGFAPYEGK